MGKLQGVNCAIVNMHAVMVHFSGSFDRTVQSIILFLITVAVASSVALVFVIGNPKFVRNFKLGAASPATQKLSELSHDICRVYFKIIVMKILGRVHA